MKGAYEDLERAAGDARKNASTISDGQPTLAAIYGGVSGCVTSGCANRLADEQWKLRRQKLEEWRKRYPDSVTAKVALASFPLQYGWFARDSGAASSEGDALFRERIEEAHRELKGLDGPARHDPGWFASMLYVASLEGWTDVRFDALYEEAAREHPLYLQIHFAGAAYYSPRWRGSWPELRGFVRRAVEITRGQLGETLYARLNWGPSTNQMFKEGQLDWPRMKTGFERMIRDYPDPWNVNNYARFACMAQDWPTASRLVAMIDRKPVAEAWLQDLQYYERCRSHAER